jgi:VWFA-related protein
MGMAFFKRTVLALAVAALLLTTGTALAFAQGRPGPITPPSKTPPTQPQPPSGQQKQLPPPQESAQKPPHYAIKVRTEVVDVNVVVTDDNGNPIPGLKEQNFRVLLDKQPQTITNFAPTDAPITIVILMEYSQIYYGWFAYTGANWAYTFLNSLKPQDWVALVTFALRPHIVVDFTRNKMDVRDALQSLGYPGFSEADLFDSILFTLDRLQNVKGKKAILLISSGLNTFSSHNLDQVLRRCRETSTTIFSVGVDQPLYLWAESQGLLGSMQRLNFLQGENELSAFARITGGRSWFPRFDGQLPGIFQQVADSLRDQYTLAFKPTIPNDGKYHKIGVELVAPDGKRLVIVNQHHKKVKYHIYARQGYMAPKPLEEIDAKKKKK